MLVGVFAYMGVGLLFCKCQIGVAGEPGCEQHERHVTVDGAAEFVPMVGSKTQVGKNRQEVQWGDQRNDRVAQEHCVFVWEDNEVAGVNYQRKAKRHQIQGARFGAFLVKDVDRNSGAQKREGRHSIGGNIHSALSPIEQSPL